MKKMSLKATYVLAATTLLLTSCGGGTTINADSKASDIAAEMASMKSFAIVYKTTVNAPEMKSTSTMKQWIDVANNRHAVETESVSEMMGMKNTDKSLMISKDGWSYMINLMDKTGFKSKDMADGEDPTELIKPENNETFRQMIEKEGGKIIGNETYLGKDCIVVEMTEKGGEGETMTTKMWYYKGIPLKLANDFYSMEAVTFEENISIPDEKFEIPAGISMSEMPGNQ